MNVLIQNWVGDLLCSAWKTCGWPVTHRYYNSKRDTNTIAVSPWTPVSMVTTLGIYKKGEEVWTWIWLTDTCLCVCWFTSFWWWTSYSVLCLSSVGICRSGIGTIFIPVTGRRRKSSIYYRWWHSATFSHTQTHSNQTQPLKHQGRGGEEGSRRGALGARAIWNEYS